MQPFYINAVSCYLSPLPLPVTGPAYGNVPAMTTAKRPQGRPRKGPGGSAVRALPPFTVRLPLPVLARLKALSVLRGASASVLIAEALTTMFDNVQAEDVRPLGTNARRIVERLRVQYPDAE